MIELFVLAAVIIVWLASMKVGDTAQAATNSRPAGFGAFLVFYLVAIILLFVSPLFIGLAYAKELVHVITGK